MSRLDGSHGQSADREQPAANFRADFFLGSYQMSSGVPQGATKMSSKISEMKLSANQLKKIRRYFGVSTHDIRRTARKSGESLKQHYQKLYNDMINKKKNTPQENWVEASFWQWVEVKDHHQMRGNTTKEFNGVDYIKTGNTRKPYTFVIPESLAHDWGLEDIEKLREISTKYPAVKSLIDMLDCLVGGEIGSGSIVLEFVSKKTVKIPDAAVPPPTKAKNKNGVRHMISKYCRSPVHSDFKPTFKEQYVQPQFTQEGTCMWNCILNEFKSKWDEYYKKKKLTYETIAEIIKKEPGEACWDDFIPFFEKLKCNITMINKAGVVEAKFEVPRAKRNNHVGRALVLVRHDAHTYWVQDESMKKSIAHKEEKEDKSDYVSDKIREVPDLLDVCGVVSSLDEMRQKALVNESENQVYIWKGEESLNEVFEHLWFNEGVQASIDSFAGIFKALCIPFGAKNVKIRVPSQEPHETPQFSDTRDIVYTRYEELMHETRKKFLDKSSKSGYLSRYSDDLMDVLRQSLGCPIKGLFEETDETDFIGLDQSKCYPYQLCQIKHIGVFCPLDELILYDGHKIQDTTLYQFANGEARFGLGVSKSLGEPVSFIRPFRVKKNTLGGIIKKVMTDDVLPQSQKKSICNIVIGQTGKSMNRRCKFEVFENEAEALRFTEIYDDEPDPSMVRELCDGKLWLAEIRHEGQLSEGFRVIQKMIYDKTKKHIEDTVLSLESRGIKALGVKIDSVFVSKEDAEKLDYPFSYEGSIWDSMGKIKKEHKKKGDMGLIVKREVKPIRAKPVPKAKVFTLNARDRRPRRSAHIMAKAW